MPSIKKIESKVRHLDEKTRILILRVVFFIGIVCVAMGMIFSLPYLIIIGLILVAFSVCVVVKIRRGAAEEK